jgi:hypothetical protein
VKKLFPRLRWDLEGSGRSHSPRPGDFRSLGEDVGIVSLRGATHRKQKQHLRGIAADVLRVPRSLGLFHWLLGYRYLLAPTMIDMIGKLRSEE